MVDYVEVGDETKGFSQSLLVESGDTYQGRLRGIDDEFPDAGFDDGADFLKIEVSAGSIYFFDADYLQPNVNTVPPIVTVYNTDIQSLSPFSTDAPNGESRYLFEEAGTYFIRIGVSQIYDSGAYLFSLEEEAPAPVTLRSLETHVESLTFDGAFDATEVVVVAGLTYRFVVSQLDGLGGASPLALAQFVVRDDQGAALLTVQGADIVDGTIGFEASATGEVSLEVYVDGSGAGEYQIEFIEDALPPTDNLPNVLRGDAEGNSLRLVSDRGATNEDYVVVGYDGNDILASDGGDDSIFGGAGNDQLAGGAGVDTLWGGDGQDYLSGNSDDDFLFGEGGDDSLLGSTGRDSLFGGDGDDYLAGGTSLDHMFGGAGNDEFRGAAGGEVAYGGAGDDRLYGGAHRDSLFGDDGNDHVSGGTYADWLYGGDGNDRMYGGRGKDELFGGVGNDRLVGGTQDDALTGGSGADVFHFDFQGGNDVVYDFENNIDRIQFDNFVNLNQRADAMAFATAVGNDVVFDFGGGDTLTILNTNTGSVWGDVFIV